jgi:acyl carrier protein
MEADMVTGVNTKEALFKKLVELISAHTGADQREIKFRKNFTRDFGLDYQTEARLIIQIEEFFDVSIPDDLAVKLVTVGDVFRCLKKIFLI